MPACSEECSNLQPSMKWSLPQCPGTLSTLPRWQPSQHSQLRAGSHPCALESISRPTRHSRDLTYLAQTSVCWGEVERTQLLHPLKYKTSEIVSLYKSYEFFLHHSTLFNSMLSNWDVTKYMQQIYIYQIYILWYIPEFASNTSGKGQNEQCIFGRQAINGKCFKQKGLLYSSDNYTIQCCSNWAEKKEHFPMCSLQTYKKSAAVQHYPSFADAQLTHLVCCCAQCALIFLPLSCCCGPNSRIGLKCFASLYQPAFSVPAVPLVWLSCCPQRAFKMKALGVGQTPRYWHSECVQVAGIDSKQRNEHLKNTTEFSHMEILSWIQNYFCIQYKSIQHLFHSFNFISVHFLLESVCPENRLISLQHMAE